jgi:chemotaxis protein CheD
MPRHTAPGVRLPVLPGQITVCLDSTVLSTVLGSCVAVCVWDCKLQIGGMSHFLLPHHLGRRHGEPGRFGELAVSILIERMTEFGSRAGSLQAKLFGGAALSGTSQARALGTKNVEVARQALAARGIPVVSEEVGGERGRKLIFATDDGEAWVCWI